MQVRLSQPTNLIKLNIDLKFKCNAMSDLNDKIQSQIGTAPIDNKPQAEQPISTTDTQSNVAKRLGLFSLKGFAEDQLKVDADTQ